VGVGRLPLVAQLGDRLLLVLGHKDRVETEAARPAGLVDDAAFEDAGPSLLLAFRRDGDQLADVARTSVLHAVELGEQAPDVFPAGEARRLDPRAAAQPVDLEAGVLAEHPRRRLQRVAKLSLRPGVLVVRRARLRRVLLDLERLDLPAAESSPELTQLAGILRGEPR
jgi:hypothetical protein